MIKEYVIEIDDCESLPTCNSCLLSKITKSLFKEKSEKANDVLGLIHTDVCGPMNINVREDLLLHYVYRRPIEVWVYLSYEA